jgi:hypothetical protein
VPGIPERQRETERTCTTETAKPGHAGMLVLLAVTVLLALAVVPVPVTVITVIAVPVPLALVVPVILVPLVFVLVLRLARGPVSVIVLGVPVRVPVAVPVSGLRGRLLRRDRSRRSGRRGRGRRSRLRGGDGRSLHVDGPLPRRRRPCGRPGSDERRVGRSSDRRPERVVSRRAQGTRGKRSRRDELRRRSRMGERESGRRFRGADDEPRKLQRGDCRGPEGRGNDCDCQNPAQTLPLSCRFTLAWYRRNRPEPKSEGSP